MEKSTNVVTIYALRRAGETVEFAAKELEKYLKRSNPAIMTALNLNESNYDALEKSGIWLGLCEQFTEAPMSDGRTKNANDYDDRVYIDVKGCTGIISGSNSRSVLLAVYRYLTELGFRWIRPGEEGEVVPDSADQATKSVHIDESASYRYRGICLEGAVKVENVLAMIDWLPKIGMNSYFIQFRNGYVFFDRWYNHVNHPRLQTSGGVTEEAAQAYVDACAAEISKRGLIYQAVGHGWTCTPFGLPGSNWSKWESDLSAEVIPVLASVKGERALWEGIPLNTELCYSNPLARRKMIEEILAYVLCHRMVDLLHVWLSDGYNNHCECPECSLRSPSDHYLVLMNELDSALTAAQLKTRIVFLIYHELLWAPETERFVNPDRFVLMFAPISRSYRRSFDAAALLPDIPSYVRNEIALPQGVEDNVAFLRKWQQVFRGDGFNFDYHFMWEHQMDPGHMRMAQVLHEDIMQLEGLGLNGLISCQVQRAFFPNGFGLTVMGGTLWQSNASFETLSADYFASAYGADAALCLQYMNELSAFFFLLNTEIPPDLNRSDEGMMKRFEELIAFMERFGEVIERNKGKHDQLSRNVSWEHLSWHREIWSGTLSALELLYRGEKRQAIEGWETIREKLWEQEERYQSVLDVFNFVLVVGGFFYFESDSPPNTAHYLISAAP